MSCFIGPRDVAGYTVATAVLLLGCCVLPIGAAVAQTDAFSVEAVKAAYVCNFGTYVEWPADQLIRGELVIGVVGAEDVADELRDLLPGRTIQGRQLQVRVLSPNSSLKGVHILYIGKLPPKSISRLIDATRRQSTLVITDTPEGLQLGGMINFILEGRRLRFEISRSAAERAGLKLSSRLLAVALRVHSSGLFPGSLPSERVLCDAADAETHGIVLHCKLLRSCSMRPRAAPRRYGLCAHESGRTRHSPPGDTAHLTADSCTQRNRSMLTSVDEHGMKSALIGSSYSPRH